MTSTGFVKDIASGFVYNSECATATIRIILLTVDLSFSSISPSILGECPRSAPSGGRGPDPPSSPCPAWTETGHHRGGPLSAAALPARELAGVSHWAGQQTPTHQSHQSYQLRWSQRSQWSRPCQTSLPSEWTCRKMLSGNSGWTGKESSYPGSSLSHLLPATSVFLLQTLFITATRTFSSCSEQSSSIPSMFCLFWIIWFCIWFFF